MTDPVEEALEIIASGPDPAENALISDLLRAVATDDQDTIDRLTDRVEATIPLHRLILALLVTTNSLTSHLPPHNGELAIPVPDGCTPEDSLTAITAFAEALRLINHATPGMTELQHTDPVAAAARVGDTLDEVGKLFADTITTDDLATALASTALEFFAHFARSARAAVAPDGPIRIQ